MNTVWLIFSIFYLCYLTQVNCDERGARVRRIVGGIEANYPPFDDPAVYLRFNGRAARVVGVRQFPHYVFKGIKYAFAPTGNDRFLRPRQKFLEGDIRATTYSAPCVQPVPGKNFTIGDEDCLALNIFTPDLPSGTEGLPVIVWIHGGGFRYGSASQYGVQHLVGKNVVVVTIQYRLGSLGFLSTGSRQLPGNAALWDMALAIQWVRNYIGFFGGNPHRINVMGHGTGASSALLVALSNIAKGVPCGVIAMSGTQISQWAIDDNPLDLAHQIAEHNGCPTISPVVMVKCLQKLPAENIIRGDSNIEFRRLQDRGFMSGLSGKLGTAPVNEGVNDGRSLPGLIEHDPVESLYKQNNPKIPLLTGVTKDETKKAVNGPLKTDALQKLKSIPNFLNNVLVKNLQGTLGIGKLNGQNVSSGLGLEKIDSMLPINFGNYLKVPKNDLTASLNKIAEATADALFNAPAFLTALQWKGAPTFLYSFEHIGNMKKGSAFLQGLPIVGNAISELDNSAVSHGDELAYLFDANDLNGKPLKSEKPTSDDLKVREVFTQMIVDFARHGAIRVDNKPVPSFSGPDNNFIQIKPKPVLSNKFKFCEMALWTNLGQRLKSGSCQFLKALDISQVSQTLVDTIDKTQGIIPGLNINKGLALSETDTDNKKVVSKPKIQNPLSPLVGILG